MSNIKKKILIVGGGGHAKVVIDAIKKSRRLKAYGVIDPALKKGTSLLDIPVIGGDDVLQDIFRKGIKYAFIGVGSIGDSSIRKKIYGKLKNIGFKLPHIVHPKAVVAHGVLLEEGVFVAAGAVINTGTIIGKNAIINTCASIDHDCKIGDFVHIAPGATLSGGVKVEAETHIGTGANIIQYINIGKQCLIAAGKTVIADIADKNRITIQGTYAGQI